MKHCCPTMNIYASKKNDILKYEANIRSYDFLTPNGESGDLKSFQYCPWCSTKLPEDLDEEWGEALEKDHGISEPFIETDYEDLPEEFKTDAWWKKRGL